MKKNILSAVAIFTAVLALAACQNREEMNESLRKQVNIIATIDGQIRSAQTRTQMQDDGSGKFVKGDKIALNHFTEEDKKGTILPYTLSTTVLYWDEVAKMPDALVGFRGWYPYFEPKKDELGGTVYNVAGAADDMHRDLLVSSAAIVKVGKPVALVFRHMMHKLTVTLTSNYFSADDLKKAKLTLTGFKSHAKVDIMNATVDAGKASGNGSYPSATGAKTSFIVAPQDLKTGEEMIRIEVGGMKFAYLVPQAPGTAPDGNYRLESGKTLKLTLRIDRNGVSLDGMTIAPWDVQGEHEGNVKPVEQP